MWIFMNFLLILFPIEINSYKKEMFKLKFKICTNDFIYRSNCQYNFYDILIWQRNFVDSTLKSLRKLAYFNQLDRSDEKGGHGSWDDV